MKTIAINTIENLRVVLFGDLYVLQTKVFCFGWINSEESKEEFMASKWILKYGLKIEEDYPTIAEIRERQKK